MIAYHHQTMSTGVQEIDDQHQELIRKLNALFERMKAGEGPAGLKELLDFLGKYAAWHFGREEACMGRYSCPVAAANRTAHAEFIRVFTEFRQRLEREGPSTRLTLEIQQRLSDWLRNHIVKVDTKLKECVTGTRVA